VAVTDGWVEFESAMGCVAVADTVLPVVPFAAVGIDIALTVVADPVLVAEPFASVGVDVALTVVVDPVLVIDPFAVVGVDVALTGVAVASVDSAKLCGKLSSDINSEGGGVDVALTGVAVASVDSAKLCGKLSSDINSEGGGVDDVDSWCWSPYCAGSDATVSYWTVISPVLGS